MKPVPTADGSLTCFHAETGELYHNKAGAYTEALVNYVQPSGAGIILAKTGTLRVLDVCYGLGYNTWVLINELLKDPPEKFSITVTAVERDEETLAFLPHVLEFPSFDTLKSKTASLEHNTYYRTQADPPLITIPVGERGSIRIDFLISDLRKSIPGLQGEFDLIFHDPFSPQKSPELWTVDLFKEYARLLARPHGRILTYSAAGAIRGGFREADLAIGRTDGVGIKSSGTVAGFAPGFTENLSSEEEAFLKTMAGIPYRDPGFNNTSAWIKTQRVTEQEASGLPSAVSLRKPPYKKKALK